MARILIVFENNDADSERLKAVLREAGLASENANSITAGCEAAKSGRIQVVFSPPLMADGSWTRLLDVANHYGLSLEVILLARTFNLNQWGEALQAGAFDVLDVLCDLPESRRGRETRFEGKPTSSACGRVPRKRRLTGRDQEGPPNLED